MERETALKQLSDIRREIISIHDKTDECRYLQKRVERLQKEKEHPSPPTVVLKPENTAEKLKQTFEVQNRQHYANNHKPESAVKLVNIVLQACICILLALDLFGHRSIVIQDSMMENMAQFGESNQIMLFCSQLILSLIVMLIPLRLSFIENRKSVFFGVFIVVLICYLYMMCLMVRAHFYVVAFLVCTAPIPVAFGIISSARRNKIKSPTLTQAQKRQWQSAHKADEQAKAENIKLRTQAEKQWEDERKRRLPEIDREIKECVQEFSQIRQQIDIHMETLSKMDALCEDDKQLQIVELLIRFIKTRRADSIKEALQEYDKLIANRQLLEIEKQKLEAEIRRTAQERAAQEQQLKEQLRHQSEMEYWARDSAKNRADALRELQSIGNMIYYDIHA